MCNWGQKSSLISKKHEQNSKSKCKYNKAKLCLILLIIKNVKAWAEVYSCLKEY